MPLLILGTLTRCYRMRGLRQPENAKTAESAAAAMAVAIRMEIKLRQGARFLLMYFSIPKQPCRKMRADEESGRTFFGINGTVALPARLSGKFTPRPRAARPADYLLIKKQRVTHSGTNYA